MKHARNGTPAWLTTSEVAAQLAIDKGKVIFWIHSGQLVAVNAASRADHKPRWRISSTELEAFLLRRQSQPAAPAPRPRRRRKTSAAVREYF
jgi:excisionase family DNA binding protein